MSLVLTLLSLWAATPFETSIDRAHAAIQNDEWHAAAASLDEARAQDSALFAANNFHYLRGRVAENEGQWERAREEFKRIGVNNPLYALSLWRAARASAKLNDEAGASELLSQLPRNFPAELKMQLARESGGSIALRTYEELSTREARYERARAGGDAASLWNLIRESKDDDASLNAARLVSAAAATPGEQMEIGEVFANHRQFEEALAAYRQASSDPAFTADALYRIARIHFQQEKYSLAVDDYTAIIKEFPDTDWQKDSEYQIASCYWRLGDYRNSEKAYVDYIRKYGSTGMREAATRNLIDVYRILGENQKALASLDRALATQLSTTTRQVFLFTKAKILYSEKRYAAALAIFQQLGRMRLRSAPGSTTSDEVQYFQALLQSKLGNKTAANIIWQKLARDEFSYYGLRAAEKLGTKPVSKTAASCATAPDVDSNAIAAAVAGLQHPLRAEIDPAADVVSELIFLHLWDEAAFWMDWTGTRLPTLAQAQISYLGRQYSRSIRFADRLPKTASTRPLLYPAGYVPLICSAAASWEIDPHWLQAIIWQESKYNPTALSGAAARGLMQFIPETARAVADAAGMPATVVDRLYDPIVSIQLGAAYWSSLMQEYKSPEKALAAYNGGPINVQRWAGKSSDPELFVADIGFTETKKYVMLVFAARAAYASLE
jgi:soluble lytic murein transglycosylase-like protein/TolA-binding protein